MRIVLAILAFLIAGQAKSQIISTISGTGVAGYSGDGGPATAAQLYWPSCIVGDAIGNFFLPTIRIIASGR